MIVEVVRADEAHIEDIVCLNAFVQQRHVDYEPTFFRPFEARRMREYFQEQLGNARVAVFLAVDEGRGVGYVLVREIEKPVTVFTYSRRIIDLEQIAVDPQDQGRGIGGMLIERAVEYARECGIEHVELSVWGFNDEAQAVFRKHGFTPCLHRLRRRAGS